MSNMTIKKGWPGRIALVLVLIAGALIMILPLYWMIISSLKGQTELLQMPPTFFPKKLILNNYARVIEAIPFLRYYANSLFTGIVNTIVGVFSSALTRLHLRQVPLPAAATCCFWSCWPA